MDLEKLYIRIAPARIGILRFMIEACDGLATVTTVDRVTALLLLRYHPARRRELECVLESVSRPSGAERKTK